MSAWSRERFRSRRNGLGGSGRTVRTAAANELSEDADLKAELKGSQRAAVASEDVPQVRPELGDGLCAVGRGWRCEREQPCPQHVLGAVQALPQA